MTPYVCFAGRGRGGPALKGTPLGVAARAVGMTASGACAAQCEADGQAPPSTAVTVLRLPLVDTGPPVILQAGDPSPGAVTHLPPLSGLLARKPSSLGTCTPTYDVAYACSHMPTRKVADGRTEERLCRGRRRGYVG